MKRQAVYIGQKYYWSSMMYMKPFVWKKEFKIGLKDSSFCNVSDIELCIEHGDEIILTSPTNKEKELAEKYLKDIKNSWLELKTKAKNETRKFSTKNL